MVKGEKNMDPIHTQALVEMGTSLTELAVKGTVSAVSKKIRAAKEIKEVEKLRSTYDELINEILLEREEAVRIAQAYKSELDRIVISDEDILHLHATVSSVLDIIKSISPTTPIESFEVLKDLISVDTLKTMQLLGFNYKAAIGEPLTQLCSDAILKLGNKSKFSTNQNKKH